MTTIEVTLLTVQSSIELRPILLTPVCIAQTNKNINDQRNNFRIHTCSCSRDHRSSTISIENMINFLEDSRLLQLQETFPIEPTSRQSMMCLYLDLKMLRKFMSMTKWKNGRAKNLNQCSKVVTIHELLFHRSNEHRET